MQVSYQNPMSILESNDFFRRYSRENQVNQELNDFHGWLTWKNDSKKLNKLYQKSIRLFFCFHIQGKYLCYYDHEPVIFIVNINIDLDLSQDIFFRISCIYPGEIS